MSCVAIVSAVSLRFFRGVVLASMGIVLVFAASASAQQRPLVTEDPEVIGAGRILLEGGVEFGRAQEYPASGLTGNLWRVPIGVSVGLGSIVELQIDGSIQDHLAITERVPAPLS